MIRTLTKRTILKFYEWRLINIGRTRRIINYLGINDA